MFYYINLLRRAPRNNSKPFTAQRSDSKTFITDLNFTKSEPQFGGLDVTPQITPNLEHFTDMSGIDADSDPEHINNDGEMDGEMDGESEEDSGQTDIAEVTLPKPLSKQDLEEFIEVFQGELFQDKVLQGADLEPGIERLDPKSANFAYFELVQLTKSKARLRETRPGRQTESSEGDAESEESDEDSEEEDKLMETEKSDRPITYEPTSEVIIEIEAILRLGALPVCELDESIINVELCCRWRRPGLTVLSLEEIDKIEPVSEALFTKSIYRANSNSEPSIVITSDTDAGARVCGKIGKIHVHSYDCPGDETSAIVESDRFCILRVIDGTARPAPLSPTAPGDLPSPEGGATPTVTLGDRHPFGSVLADTLRATTTHRGRSPP